MSRPTARTHSAVACLIVLTACSTGNSDAAPVAGAPTGPSAPAAPAMVVAAPNPEIDTFVRGAKQLFVGAGDIAMCDSQGDELTAALLDRYVALNPATQVFTLGDNAYGAGTVTEYRECYGPTWGRFKDRTFPVIGNHDARTDRGRPYHDFFGPRAGAWGQSFVAVDLGAWRIIGLNSNCDQVDCSAEGDQARFLTAELEAREGKGADLATRTACTAVLWHAPIFSSGPHGDAVSMQALWRIVATHDVEMVLSGHDHIYERFAPADVSGKSSANGVLTVVAGTGGADPYPLQETRPGSIIHFTGKPGVLALDLRPDGYQGRFAAVTGETLDRFEGRCR